ncbi:MULTISPECIES: DJ-1/PfpI family protein [Dactylosporangium]|uniref:Glutamine amidotransferase n=2 Tax=Dactylosporangium TaxID=35753 RepID=A0A9W6NNL0_9ACTN|nr:MULTISPECIES: DJ-1/PfpI family protein [Dactylosporangium]UAC00514.1 DJ-1/PfpI family protein [Dactylosporangium vinaceum]UWZ48082.1 DJ-1/PfpI family protein [Dactylosporangium matsuzakiense]GLL03569.1 glutamine amidotransferase [Dactylosporangium matsuzakiense]
MRLAGHRIAVLIESDFYEHEIWYYSYRFPEEGAEVHFLTRLWGQPQLTFTGHEYKAPFVCERSFEDLDDAALRSYSAVIVPSAFVSDRLRYSENLSELPPATRFLQRAFAEPTIVKGIICHGLWLLSRTPELVRGREVTCHPNLYGDALNMGARYVDRDVVVDGDLVTGRTGAQAGLFARAVIDRVAAAVPAHV